MLPVCVAFIFTGNAISLFSYIENYRFLSIAYFTGLIPIGNWQLCLLLLVLQKRQIKMAKQKLNRLLLEKKSSCMI